MTDLEYRRIAETTIDDVLWVSTVWLGLDHSLGRDGPPLIFETMVFPLEGGDGPNMCDWLMEDEEAS